MNKGKILVIVGPTASGKSDLAVKIAKKFNGEIVSADSRQIYRGMDIGTAKPGKKEIAAIKHHLLDIKNPNQDYTAGQFKKDAIRAISKIIKLGKLPILVGGTGLYVDAVVKNIEFPEVKRDKKLRARLEEEIKKCGLDYIFQKLIDLDPEAAYIVDPKNPRRVIRALEVALISGKPFSAQRKTGRPLYDILEVGINIPSEMLKERIIRRIKQMVRKGLVNETRGLIRRYGKSCKTFDTIGYREIIDYLRGKISLTEAIEQMNRNTWHYAKRQIAWFKRDKKIRWFNLTEKSAQAEILNTISDFLHF